MTKAAIAARRRYRAKKAGVPNKRKKKGSGFGGISKADRKKLHDARLSVIAARNKRRGSGLRKRGKGQVGAGFWDDVGNFFTHTIPDVFVQAAPMVLAAL